MHGIMRLHGISAMALLACGLAFASCDFPSDPPLKKVVPPPPPPPVFNIDSASVLLPLHPANKWSFIVVSYQSASQMASIAKILPLDWQGDTFSLLRYYYWVGGGYPTAAFPPVLQNDSLGLHMYERGSSADTVTLSRAPKIAFVLPYPSAVGTTWSSAESEYTVRVAAKDTVITGYNDFTQYRCYRYNVDHRGRPKYVIHAMPGVAIMRVDYDNLVFFTTAWELK